MKQETIDAKRKWLGSFSEKPLSETDQAVAVGMLYGALYEIEELQKIPTKPVVDVKPRWCQMCGNKQPLKNTNEDALGRTNCAFCGAAIVQPQFPVSLEDALVKCVELQGFVDWFETQNVGLCQVIKQLVKAGDKCAHGYSVLHQRDWRYVPAVVTSWRALADKWGGG